MYNHYSFIGGSEGPWRVTSCETVVGMPLETVQRVNVFSMPSAKLAESGIWVLQSYAALIPIKKSRSGGPCHKMSGEQFDFITWFEFAPEHAAAFNKLVAQLRASKEWEYVEREIDIRLVRDV